ncbi:TPA: cobalt ABC transporter permease, partial [Salmonella enterica subsp. enterica serovar Poona]
MDAVTEQVFDVCHRVSGSEAFRETYALARELKPAVVYYAGVGMFPYSIYLSNLRLAPLQLVGLGHGASTFCGQLDGFVVEEDFVGDPACFSERVCAVPADSMP